MWIQLFWITVFTSRDGRSIYFKSCHSNYKYTINLLLDCEHYSVVLRPTAAFATSYFCKHCSVAYTTQLVHRKCVVKCNSCLYSPPCQKQIDITCRACNRTFLNPDCYQNHKNIKLCSKLRLCLICSVCYTVKKKSDHICGQSYCVGCKCLMPIRHECYMPIKRVKDQTKNGFMISKVIRISSLIMMLKSLSTK